MRQHRNCDVKRAMAKRGVLRAINEDNESVARCVRGFIKKLRFTVFAVRLVSFVVNDKDYLLSFTSNFFFSSLILFSSLFDFFEKCWKLTGAGWNFSCNCLKIVVV